jgi:hypothetical protein
LVKDTSTVQERIIDFASIATDSPLTMCEVERYTRMADRARNARRAMQGRYEQEGNTKSPESVTPRIVWDTLKA